MIVDVHCDDGTTQIARIVLESGDTYTVNFLEKTNTVYTILLISMKLLIKVLFPVSMTPMN